MGGRTRDEIKTIDPSSGFAQSWFLGSDAGYASSLGTLSHRYMQDATDGTPPPYSDKVCVQSLYWDETFPLNGQQDASGVFHYYTDFHNYWAPPGNGQSHCSAYPNFTASPDFNGVAARTNPSRPDLTPLTLWQDIVDLPKMIRDVGRTFGKRRGILSPRELANQTLAQQFGWIPLIKDVQDILSFGSKVEKRHRELSKLYARGWIGRTIQLKNEHYTEDSSSDLLYGSSGFGATPLELGWHKTTQAQQWGSSRWRLTVAAPHNPTDAEVLRQARRLASGLTPEGLAKGAWEILPWTWLTDWFTHTGSFVSAYSNTVPAELTSCCIMTKVETQTQYFRKDGQKQVTGGDGTQFYTTFNRQVGYPSLSQVSLPNLSAHDLLILGSLFIQRFKNL